MTTFSKTDFVCRICDNNVDNLEFLAVEMLFGTKDEFKYVECSKCKCIQIKNIPQNLAKYYPKDYNSFDPVLKIYDSIIKKYFKKIMAKDYLENNLNVFTKLLFNLFGAGFLEKIKPTKINFNSSILDIGSGNGLRLVGLARYGFQNITGIDPFIDKDIEYENGIKIYKKDLMDIDGQFDMIMLNHSYEHMTNPEEVLIKAKTLLKNNGVLLIRIPISNSFSWKKYGTNWVALDPPRHIYLHNQQTIDILAKRTGFELAHILYDSTEYQFVGSEQYIRGIPMFSNKSYYRNKENSIFTEDQIRSYKEKAKKLNKSSKGDMACFYLKKVKKITKVQNDIVKIEKSISSLDNWITKNGWTGFDPYDIKEVPFIIKITDLGNKYFIAEIFREILFEFFLMFPNFSRKIFKIKPQVNAKGMGLFAVSYIDLHSKYNEEKYLAKAYECITWLDNNFKSDYSGKGWGYPFSWQSKKYIPKYTPNGIVTTAVGDAYWKMFKLTNNQKYLNTCIDICEFLTNLPIDIIDENQICFSYTPLYTNHVHNLNLFVAEFLIRVGKEIDNQNWIELGIKAANYTVGNQLENGAFDYNGPPEKPQNIIDHYHTCFVIRSLYAIWNLTNDEKYFNSLSLCFNHYKNNFFINDTIPKYTPTRKYRIDIHSCAEAINCLSEISDIFPEGRKIALNVANWTIDNLQSKKGFFYHGIFKSRILQTPFISKIAYIRWGQAWMLKGLSNLLRIQKDYKEIEN